MKLLHALFVMLPCGLVLTFISLAAADLGCPRLSDWAAEYFITHFSPDEN